MVVMHTILKRFKSLQFWVEKVDRNSRQIVRRNLWRSFAMIKLELIPTKFITYVLLVDRSTSSITIYFTVIILVKSPLTANQAIY